MKRDKIKDMIRSILPSTARRRARFEKAYKNRELRRSVRTDLRRANPKADLHRSTHLSMMVAMRRGSDKLNHFVRWCHAITKGMDSETAIGHVRSLVPSSLIGDHALGHWINEVRPVMYGRWFRLVPRQSLQSFLDSTTFRLRRALIVDPTLHGRLNAVIKARKMFDEPRRLLAGAHDVGEFVKAIAGSDYEIERRVTLELIEQIEKQKGGRRAALRVSGGRVQRYFFLISSSARRALSLCGFSSSDFA
jgi:hypothetical protein